MSCPGTSCLWDKLSVIHWKKKKEIAGYVLSIYLSSIKSLTSIEDTDKLS